MKLSNDILSFIFPSYQSVSSELAIKETKKNYPKGKIDEEF